MQKVYSFIEYEWPIYVAPVVYVNNRTKLTHIRFDLYPQMFPYSCMTVDIGQKPGNVILPYGMKDPRFEFLKRNNIIRNPKPDKFGKYPIVHVQINPSSVWKSGIDNTRKEKMMDKFKEMYPDYVK